MTTTFHTLPPAVVTQKHMRQIKIPQDLTPVADLIETCFAATLDEDGRRFIRQMRRAGQNKRGYQNFNRLSPSIKGHVWIEDGQIIGNLNLIPVVVRGKRAFLIVNVAVHPNFRRRGIANALTSAGLETAIASGGSEAWLQVDINNKSAQNLYNNFGFWEKARRTVWHSAGDFNSISIPPDIVISHRKRKDWRKQRRWLNQLYGPDVRWNLPLNIDLFAPNLLMQILRFASEYEYEQWSASKNGKWIGSVSWQSSYSQADKLWLAAPPEHRAEAITALLPHAVRTLNNRRKITPGRTFSINLLADDCPEALEAAGFQHHQTLIWMRKSLK